jgi:hypothetical protein
MKILVKSEVKVASPIDNFGIPTDVEFIPRIFYKTHRLNSTYIGMNVKIVMGNSRITFSLTDKELKELGELLKIKEIAKINDPGKYSENIK